MVREKEELCVTVVEKVLRSVFGTHGFSVNGPQESAACLERSDSGWCVYNYERGQEFSYSNFSNVVEACLDLLRRMTPNADVLKELNDMFLSEIIGTVAA